MDTYHLFQPEDFLALVCQINLRHSNLPALITPPQLCARSTSDNLMTETNSHNPHPPTIDSLLCELNQLDNPGIVVKCRMSRTGNKHSVNILERRVRVYIVDHVVALNRDQIVEVLRRAHGLGRGVEKGCKDPRVAAISIAGLWLGRVGLKDCETERRHCGVVCERGIGAADV